MRSYFNSRTLLAAAMLSATALAGCANPTTYRPATGYRGNNGTGFTDQRVEANRFVVTFAGNSMTSRERVEKYLLFRAAELTVQNGFDTFTFVDRDTERKTDTYVDRFGGGFGGYGGGFGYGGFGRGYGFGGASWRYARRGFGFGGWGSYGGDPFFDDYQVRQIDRYEASAEIQTSRGPKPGGDRFAFDARDVIANLGPTIEYPGDRNGRR